MMITSGNLQRTMECMDLEASPIKEREPCEMEGRSELTLVKGKEVEKVTCNITRDAVEREDSMTLIR